MPRKSYPRSTLPLNGHAVQKFRRTLDQVDRWDALTVDRATTVALYEAKADKGTANPYELEELRRQRIALGLRER